MIAIIGALDQEIEAFLHQLAGVEVLNCGPFRFHCGMFDGHDVVIAKSGVGKVLAAMTTQRIIDQFQPTNLIFTGIAGGLNPALNIGDVVIGENFIQHDLDVRALGFKLGEIPFTGLRVIEADQRLLEAASGLKLTDRTVVRGRILSGDQFITESDRDSHQHLRDELQGDAVEMEGASVATVCHLNRTPFIAIRTISDKADGSAHVDFNAFLPMACEQSLLAVRHILKAIITKV